METFCGLVLAVLGVALGIRWIFEFAAKLESDKTGEK
jgi:hypothetical protein